MKKILQIATTDSTNKLLQEKLSAGEEIPDGYVISAAYQTAGRGQQGNSWESEAGSNLLFSMLLKGLTLPIDKQFAISELVTLAIVNVLNSHLRKADTEATIKWPNDIYWQNKKLAGILIENSLMGGHIASSIVGVGLNVNQTTFTSNAPNPVSLKEITGSSWDCAVLLEEIIDEIGHLRPMLNHLSELKTAYMMHLYRRNEWHMWKENTCSSEPINILQGAQEGMFEAQVMDVEDNGLLVLQDREGQLRKYHFKEIKYVLQ